MEWKKNARSRDVLFKSWKYFYFSGMFLEHRIMVKMLQKTPDKIVMISNIRLMQWMYVSTLQVSDVTKLER